MEFLNRLLGRQPPTSKDTAAQQPLPPPPSGPLFMILVRRESECLKGFIDANARLVIEPRFRFVTDFSDGVAMYMKGESPVYGYIDTTGRTVIEPQLLADAGPFSEGLALISLPYQRGWQWIDKQASVIISDPKFTGFGGAFRSARVAARVGERWGWIDRTGRFVIEPEFDEVGLFADGLTWVRSGDRYALIDERGARIAPLPGRAWTCFGSGLLQVKTEQGTGYVDRSGAFAIPPRFDYGGVHVDGLAWVRKNGKFGFIDARGDWVIGPDYDSADDFVDGLAHVERNGKHGFIDATGREAIPLVYARAQKCCRDGLVRVVLGEESGPAKKPTAEEGAAKDQYLDRDGHVVWEGRHWSDY